MRLLNLRVSARPGQKHQDNDVDHTFRQPSVDKPSSAAGARRNHARFVLAGLFLLMSGSDFFASGSHAIAGEDPVKKADRVAIVASRSDESLRNRHAWLEYSHQLSTAMHAWDLGDTGEAMTLLSSCQADLRGWEFNYLLQLMTADQRICKTDSPVLCTAFSPDGKLIAIGSGDSMEIRDSSTGEILRKISPRTEVMNAISSVAFSRDGKKLIALTDDVLVIDVESGAQRIVISSEVFRAGVKAISPDGQFLATGGSDDQPIILEKWEPGFEPIKLEAKAGSVDRVAFSSDGQRLVSRYRDGSIRLWDVPSGRLLETRLGNPKFGSGIAISPDGKRIAIGEADNTVRIWDLALPNELRTLQAHTGVVTCIEFSADGRQIVTGSDDQTLKLWDAESGRELKTFKGHADRIFSVAISPDCERIASVSGDKTLRIWKTPSVNAAQLAIQGRSGPACFSPDGQRMVGRSENALVVWSTSTGKDLVRLHTRSHWFSKLFSSADGTRIAGIAPEISTRRSSFVVWDSSSGEVLHEDEEHRIVHQSLAFSQDGKKLTVASGRGSMGSGNIKLWDLTTGKVVRTLNETAGMFATVVSASDGKLVAGVSRRELFVSDADTGEIIRKIYGQNWLVTCMAISLDAAKIAVADSENTITVWDARSGDEVIVIEPDVETETDAKERGLVAPEQRHFNITCLAFSHDGRRLVSGGADKKLKVWELTTGQELLTLRGHKAAVTTVEFSPNGQWLLSSDSAGALKIWDGSSNEKSPASQK